MTMVASTDWASLTVAGAFVLGAFLATLATIRVVRAVTMMFDERPLRRRRRRDEDGDAE